MKESTNNKHEIEILKEQINLKTCILESYAEGELESKRPELYYRLTNDIKALNLAALALENQLLSIDEAVFQLNDMVNRYAEIDDVGCENNQYSVSQDGIDFKGETILENDILAVKKGIELLNEFLNNPYEERDNDEE